MRLVFDCKIIYFLCSIYTNTRQEDKKKKEPIAVASTMCVFFAIEFKIINSVSSNKILCRL